MRIRSIVPLVLALCAIAPNAVPAAAAAASPPGQVEARQSPAVSPVVYHVVRLESSYVRVDVPKMLSVNSVVRTAQSVGDSTVSWHLVTAADSLRRTASLTRRALMRTTRTDGGYRTAGNGNLTSDSGYESSAGLAGWQTGTGTADRGYVSDAG